MRRVGIALAVLIVVLLAVPVIAIVVLQQVDWNQYKEPIADAVRDATGRELDLGGDVALDVGLRPGIRIEQVGFSNADWGTRPEMARLDRLVVRFELLPLLGGEVVVERLELAGLDLLLETREDGSVNWEFQPKGVTEVGNDEPVAEAEPPSSGSPADGDPPASGPPTTGEPTAAGAPPVHLAWVEIRDAGIVLRDQATGSEERIGVDRLLAQMDAQGGPMKLELDAAYQEQPLQLRGRIQGLPGEPMSIELALETGATRLEVSGGLGDPADEIELDLDVHVVAPRLAALGPLAGGELPDLPPLEARLRLGGGGEHYTVRELDFSVGSSRLQGEVDAVLAAGGDAPARPRIEARLTSPLLDLADFQGKQAQDARVRPAPGIVLAAVGDAPAADSGPLFSREPIDLSGLEAVDASVTLDAALLRVAPNELTDLDIDLDLSAARLRIRPLAGGTAGGRFDLAIDLDASRKQPRLALSGNARGVRLGDLAAAQGSEEVEDGPVDLDLDLAGRGTSVHAIVSSLGGSFAMKMGEAIVQNDYATIALSDLKALRSGQPLDQARVACVLGNFDVKKGVAVPKVLVADLRSIALFGSGKVDLGRERMDLEFDRVAQTASVSGVLPPFTLEGPLQDPKAGIAAGALIGKAIDFATGRKNKREDAGEPPSGCAELWAAYQEEQSGKRDSGQQVIEDTGGRVIDGLKGLFDR